MSPTLERAIELLCARAERERATQLLRARAELSECVQHYSAHNDRFERALAERHARWAEQGLLKNGAR
jgi:hypothetical protein